MFRQFMIVCWVFLAIPALAEDKKTLMGAGWSSCGEMLAEVKVNEDIAHLFYFSWVQGFLSGVNYGSAPDVEDAHRYMVDISDTDGQWAWLKNYCDESPIDKVHTAAQKLFFELLNRQKLVLFSSPVSADGFIAVCDADGVHAYRHDTNMSGESMGAEWASGEKFPGKFRFSFDGEKIEIDGKESIVVYWNGNVLVAMDGATTDVSASAWTYAFNLDLEEVVGAQVNAYRTIGTGIKARAVNFKCEFTYK